jgi:hypothetical protein
LLPPLLLAAALVGVCGMADANPQARRDPFSKPDLAKIREPAPTKPKVARKPRAIRPPEITLNAVLLSASNPMAMANDELLAIGDEVKGMRLIAVDEGRAVFRYRGKNFEYIIE